MKDILLFRNWFRLALINFLLAASIGAILRFAFVQEIPGLQFRPFLYGHSHVAMLGWVYLGLFTILLTQLPIQVDKGFIGLFWATQFSVFGMLLAFPIQGYGPISIAFSSLHVLLSYVFIWRYLKCVRKHVKPVFGPFSFIRTGLFFLFVSTIALWAMGPIMIMDLSHKPIYYMMVQAFLHFQFNGWFVFTCLGLLFNFLEKQGIQLPISKLRLFFRLLLISCFLTYALAVTWTSPRDFLFLINSIGAGLQFIAALLFIKLLWPFRQEIIKILGSGWSGRFFKLAILCFIAKIVIQTAVIVPFLGTVAYTIRNFVIGYLHLILLGFVAAILMAFAERQGLLKLDNSLSRIGSGFFFFGFLFSEFLLFGQGLMLWAGLGFLPFYYIGLFSVSILLPIGIFLILFGNRGSQNWNVK
ncbi:MAG: hypothetical protein KDC34_14380 [Saprospiraceae bacterium]|nr:hypothetical protein [Saprospiraceae bacterium]